MYNNILQHASVWYIYTQCFDYRGRFVDGGAPVLQWEDESTNECLWTRIVFGCRKCWRRSNSCGHNVFEFHEIARKWKGALYVHHRHICACPQHFNVCIWFPSAAPEHTFKKCASGTYQTMTYKNFDFLGLRTCASSEHIKLLYACCSFCIENLDFHNFEIYQNVILGEYFHNVLIFRGVFLVCLNQ